jgi:amino acid transporter
MLESINNEEDLTPDFIASVLDAVHEDGRTIKTLYSNIFDLKNGIVYLYYMHDFKDVCKLNAYEIINSKQPPKRIKDIFPQNISENESVGNQNNSLKIGLTVGWIILVIGSLTIAFSKIFRYKGISSKKRVFWILIILFLGPIGLVFLTIAKNRNQINKYKTCANTDNMGNWL